MPSISTDRKQRLFGTLADIKFSGKILWQNPQGRQWVFFYAEGRLLCVTDNRHGAKRWHRVLKQHPIEGHRIAVSFQPGAEASLETCGEYVGLRQAVEASSVSAAAAATLLSGIAEELLLDLLLDEQATYVINRSQLSAPSPGPAPLDIQALLQKTQQLQEDWRKLGLARARPDQAPIIRSPERIREKTNKQLYQVLVTLLDGRNTLRDVALKTNRDVVQITQALRSFIQLGWIDLVEVQEGRDPQAPPPRDAQDASNGSILVACVDDSPMVCQSMENIVTAEGYRSVSVLAAQRAIATLLAKKPDIIFLDLVMPHTNGYEICSQLRKVSKFSDTPIIILSGNDGVVDQVRARLMGASDFVSKPVEPSIILSTIQRHLNSPAAVYP